MNWFVYEDRCWVFYLEVVVRWFVLVDFEVLVCFLSVFVVFFWVLVLFVVVLGLGFLSSSKDIGGIESSIFFFSFCLEVKILFLEIFSKFVYKFYF